MLRKRLSVLVGAAVMVLSMFAAAAPAFAQELGPGACDPNPGNTEASRSHLSTPPQSKPGGTVRDDDANEHDQHSALNGRGELQEQCV